MFLERFMILYFMSYCICAFALTLSVSLPPVFFFYFSQKLLLDRMPSLNAYESLKCVSRSQLLCKRYFYKGGGML